MLNPAFRNDFINTAADVLNSWYSASRAVALVDTMQAELQPAMDEHIRRWQANGGSVAGWQTRVQTLRDFAAQRTANVRAHVVTQLGLAGTSQLTLNVNATVRGSIRINRLLVNPALPGAGATPYPWTGTYFRGIPLALEAVPAPGWRFASWSGLAGGPLASLTLSASASITANFIANPPSFLTIERQPTQVRFILQGTPGATYTLQSSPDLASWSDALDFTCAGDGSAEIFAPALAGDARRFFRAVSR